MISPPAAPWFGSDRKLPQSYRGLRIAADSNLHEQLQKLITETLPPAVFPHRRPKVLDLGCGEGALAQRLFDLGYEVVAVDCEAAPFHAQGPTFLRIDLNDPAAVEQLVSQCEGAFDLILAVEVIEHLHSPWDLLNACRQMSPRRYPTDTHDSQRKFLVEQAVVFPDRRPVGVWTGEFARSGPHQSSARCHDERHPWPERLAVPASDGHGQFAHHLGL